MILSFLVGTGMCAVLSLAAGWFLVARTRRTLVTAIKAAFELGQGMQREQLLAEARLEKCESCGVVLRAYWPDSTMSGGSQMICRGCLKT